jgi:hypothetical protein
MCCGVSLSMQTEIDKCGDCWSGPEKAFTCPNIYLKRGVQGPSFQGRDLGIGQDATQTLRHRAAGIAGNVPTSERTPPRDDACGSPVVAVAARCV